VDFHIAKVLLEEILQKTIYALAPKSEEIIRTAKELLEISNSFTVRELAGKLDWDYDTAKKWFDPAFQKGYFSLVEEHKGSRAASYKLSEKEVDLRRVLPETEYLYEVNPGWLVKHKIYDPISGEVFDFKEDCTDVPMEDKSVLST